MIFLLARPEEGFFFSLILAACSWFGLFLFLSFLSLAFTFLAWVFGFGAGQTAKAAEQRMKYKEDAMRFRLVVIVDTCALMAEGNGNDDKLLASFEHGLSWISSTIYTNHRSRDYFEQSMGGKLTINILIPNEVKEELKNHFNNPDKLAAARTGRANYAKAIALEHSATVSMTDVQFPTLEEPILGPDSDVDKKIIGLALESCKDEEWGEQTIVYILTRDGGIGAEVCAQHKTNRHEIYCNLNCDRISDGALATSLRRIVETC